MEFKPKVIVIFMIRLFLGAIIGLSIACTYGCADKNDTAVVPPAITDFSANPATIHWYEVSRLSATFTGGTGVITPGGLSITSGGSVSVTPTITTTFTLTITNSLGTTDTMDVTVNVKAASEQLYSITDLGSLGGATISPAAVNDVGQVAGTARLSDGSERAFLWEKSTLVNLGTFPGYPSSQAFSINNSGQVVGTCPTGGIYPPVGPGPAGGKYPTSHAFIWKDGIMEHLGTANISDSHTPNCINDSGIVVGGTQTVWHPEAGQIWYSAVQWGNGNLYTFPGGEGSSLGSGTHAIAVNSAGLVVGSGGRGSDPNGLFHAYLWEGGTLTDMNTLVPEGSPWFLREAVGVNTRRQIIGNGAATGLSGAFIWENGTVTDLGSPYSSGHSESRGINSAGAVVGRTTKETAWRAFVWRDGWIADLNEHIPPGSGWVLEVSTSMSDTGFIVGTGKHNGVDSAFILTPQ
jgi:probable HAF family extracellular repeat protein